LILAILFSDRAFSGISLSFSFPFFGFFFFSLFISSSSFITRLEIPFLSEVLFLIALILFINNIRTKLEIKARQSLTVQIFKIK